MARAVVGLDWAVSGLKVAGRIGGDFVCDELSWSDNTAPSPGQSEAGALRILVDRRRWKGRPARVAVHRRHVVVFSRRASEAVPPVERLLPTPLSGWRWALAAESPASPAIVAIEARHLQSLRAYVERSGLRWGGAAFFDDSHHTVAMGANAGEDKSRIARCALARDVANGAGLVLEDDDGRRAPSVGWNVGLAAFAAAAVFTAAAVGHTDPRRLEPGSSQMNREDAARSIADVTGYALSALPSGMKLTGLRLDDGARLSLEGTAPSQESVAQLLTALSSAGFSGPRCLRLTTDGRRDIRFNVAATYGR